MSVRVYRCGGIVVEAGGKRLLLDPTGIPDRKPDVVFVSHAHSDHCRPSVLRALKGVPKVMSHATRDLVDPRRRLDSVVAVNAGEEVEVAGLQLEVHEAGHVIGSLQLRFDAGATVVYTGDFNLERRVVMRPAPVLKADVLVIDATYGHHRYTFPPRPLLYKAIVQTVREAVEEGRGLALAARALGTGQELTALLSLVAKVVPFVEEKIAEKNRIYEKYGEVLGEYAVHSLRPPRGAIAVVPLSSDHPGAVPCTGWAVGRGIPLSSHAGFSDLLRYVVESGVATIYAFSSFASSFASYISREMGVEAYAL
jgi:putative mRNA 3-end processing factor